MPVIVEEAGVTGMDPAILGLGLAGRVIILVVGKEHARRAIEHLAGRVDLDLDIR